MKTSRVRLYKALANKLKKDPGWNLDLLEHYEFLEKENQLHYTLTIAIITKRCNKSIRDLI